MKSPKKLKVWATSSSKESVQGMQEGYAQGKYEKSVFIEAQQAAFEGQDQYLDALAEYHRKKSRNLTPCRSII